MSESWLRKLLTYIWPGNKIDPSEFKITQEEAISIAQAECARRKWRWVTPMKVSVKWRDKWVIETGLRTKGFARQTYVIDANTGELIRAGAQPR